MGLLIRLRRGAGGLVAEAYDLADEAWSYGFLKHEGGDIGARDGEAAFGEMA